MITFIKSWCEGIVVAVMISIIIEMLLPEGNNKKYVKVIVGVYILFVIIGPFLEKINTENFFEKNFEFNTIEVSTEVNNDIKDVYIDGIEETIKTELLEGGYLVEKLNVDVDKNYENIEKIEVELGTNNKSQIQIDPIAIGEKQVTDDDYVELKKLLSENYQVSYEDIYVFK